VNQLSTFWPQQPFASAAKSLSKAVVNASFASNVNHEGNTAQSSKLKGTTAQ